MPLGGLDMEIEILDILLGVNEISSHRGEDFDEESPYFLGVEKEVPIYALEGKFRHMMEHNFVIFLTSVLCPHSQFQTHFLPPL